MEDLTGQDPALYVPSSMSEGGELHDARLAQTAPGSQPISAPEPGDFTNENLLALGVNQAALNEPVTNIVQGADPHRPDLFKYVSGATWRPA